MVNFVIKNCKGCHNPLRIPENIGGMLMRCPNCGYEFHTDFKLDVKFRQSGDDEKRPLETPHPKPQSTFRIIV